MKRMMDFWQTEDTLEDEQNSFISDSKSRDITGNYGEGRGNHILWDVFLDQQLLLVLEQYSCQASVIRTRALFLYVACIYIYIVQLCLQLTWVQIFTKHPQAIPTPLIPNTFLSLLCHQSKTGQQKNITFKHLA